jgi:RimJ/RimL family protein N-acetyltransferase
MQLIPIERDGTVNGAGELSPAVTEIVAMNVAFYDRIGCSPPWVSYLAIEEGIVVAAGGFKGPPKEGKVELAYMTFPPHENRGVATRLAQALTALALRTDERTIVTARTLIERNPSQRVLEKAGFRNAGVVVDPEDGEVLEWVYDDPRKQPSSDA